MKLTLPIRFEDIDAFGHVSHLKYLSFCETHRMTAFRAAPHASYGHIADSGFVVADLQARYIRPVYLNSGSVDVEAAVVHIGKSSLKLRYEVSSGFEMSAVILMAIVRVRDGRPYPLEEAERTWFSSQLASSVDRVAPYLRTELC